MIFVNPRHPNLICMLLLSGEIAKDVKEFQPEIKK